MSFFSSKRLFPHRFKHPILCYHQLLIILTLRFASVQGVQPIFDNVMWNITSYPVKFGNTAELSCFITESNNACSQRLRQWIGGQQYTSLCQNMNCFNVTKYHVKVETPCSYTLMIQDFSMYDVNCDYSCFYGTKSYRKNLQLNSKDFVAVPDIIHKRKMTLTEDTIDIQLYLEDVYPSPLCYASLVGKNITQDLQVNISKKEYFYNLEIELILPITLCRGNVTIYCHFGNEEKVVLNEYIGDCKDIDTTQPTDFGILSASEIAGIVVGIIVVTEFCVIVCIMLWRKRNKRKRGNDNSTAVTYKPLIEESSKHSICRNMLEGDAEEEPLIDTSEKHPPVQFSDPSMDRKERSSYIETIKSAEEVRCYVRIIVIGKNGVGKTSLIRRLLGEEMGNGVSNDGIFLTSKPLQIRKSDGTWIVGEVVTDSKKKLKTILKELSKSNDGTTSTNNISVASQNNSKDIKSNTTDSVGLSIKKTSMEKPKNLDSCGLSSPNQNPCNTEHVDRINETMFKQIEQIVLEAKIEKEKMTPEDLVECGIWDFAGQKDYYATHQTFFTPHAIYILVRDIGDDIKDLKHYGNVAFDSIGEYIDFWFDSIHYLFKDHSADKLCPPVIMVCTGSDKVHEDKIEEYENKFGCQEKGGHKRGTIHFISNTKSPKEDFEYLRKHISKTAQEMRFFAEELPTKWVQLEAALFVLKSIKEEEKMGYCERLENIAQLANMVSIAKDELRLFLKYQHQIGNVIYFEELRDYIILEPNWLVDCFRCLICDDAKKYCTETELYELKYTGMLSEHLIDKLFSKVPELMVGKYKNYILDVMEKFDIIIKPKSTNSYYIPCMIENSSALKDIKKKFNVENSNCSPWLVLEFKFLPIAHFNYILFNYISSYEVCKVETQYGQGHPAIYAGKAVIYLDQTKFRLLIICFSRNAICLQLWKWNTVEDNTYQHIMDEICNRIEELERKLVHKLYYEIKAQCSTGDYFSTIDRISYEDLAKLSKEGKYYCQHHNCYHSTKDLENTWLKNAATHHRDKIEKHEGANHETDVIEVIQSKNRREKEEKYNRNKTFTMLTKTTAMLRNVIPWNIRDQINKQIEDWEKRDQMFVSTRASNYVMECLQDNSCVTLTAPAGVGKSFIARHTAIIYKTEGYTIIPVYLPIELRNYYQPGNHTVFIIDDFCGNFTANQQQIENWKSLLPVINTVIADKCCKIIVSCRLHVYNDDKLNVLSPFKSCECNLISERLCLTSVEKTSLTKIYVGTSVDDIDDISQNCDCFPLLCSLYRTKKYTDMKGFFRNPFIVYKDELNNLSRHGDKENYKICSLALCVLFNNHLKENWFQSRMRDEHQQIIRDICEACGFNSIPKAKLKKELDTLDGTFICKQNGIYRTVHDKLFDFLAHYFGQKMIECLIDHGDSDLIHERFIWQKSPDVKNSYIDFIIEIPDDHLDSFLYRFIKDWSTGKVRVIFGTNNMKVALFRQYLLQHLKQLEKSQQVTLASTRDTVVPKDECGSGTTPLICTCFDGFEDMVQWLLNNGVNVDQFRDDGVTGLFMASQEGHTVIVKLLLEKNPKVDLCDKDGCSPLYTASDNGHTAIVKLLLEKDPNVDLCDKDGCSPLYTASDSGHTAIVKLLLEKNPNVDLCDKYGCSPLYTASKSGHIDIVKLLLKRNPNVDLCNNYGFTPLIQACYHNHTSIAQLLIKHTPNINTQTYDGGTALYFSACNGNIDITQLLLANDADCNICAYGQSAIDAIKNYPTKALDTEKQDCFYSLKKKASSHVTAYSSKKTVDYTSDVVAGSSPLHIACFMGRLDVVHCLLDHKANINITKEDGTTPLFCACEVGHDDIVRLLLDRGANTEICRLDGKSPLDIATDNGHESIEMNVTEQIKKE